MKLKLFLTSFSLLTAFILSPVMYGQDYPAGLTHYYELEESAPPYADSYGSNDGISSLQPTSTTGIVGNGQLFSQNKIDITDDGTFDWGSASSFSIEYWMKRDNSNLTDVEVIVGRDEAGSNTLHWWIGIDNQGYPLSYLLDNSHAGGGMAGTTAITDNQWHHVVMVRDGVQNKNYLYVDSIEVANLSFTYTQDFSATDVPINIGWLNLDAGYYYKGSLDEVAIYSTALAQSEIAQHYRKGLLGYGYFEIIAAPTQLTAQPGFKKVDLSWDDNSDNESGFIIERAPALGSFSAIDTVAANSTSFRDTNVTATTTYKYRVKGYNTLMQSGYSNEVTTSTPLFTISAPGSLTVVLNTSPLGADLNWNDNSSNETGFKVQRALGDIGSATVFVDIATLGAGVTSYADASVSQLTTYTYRVYAYNADTVSTFSNKADIPIPALDVDAPDQLTAQAKFQRVELAWADNSNNEDGFIIERAVQNPFPSSYTVIDMVAAGVTTYIDGNVAEMVTYKYRVKGYNSITESDYSNEILVTTLVSTVNPPSNLTAILHMPEANKVDLSWEDNSTNELGFIIQRITGDSLQVAGFVSIDTVGANMTVYTDTTVNTTTMYTYRICAYNSNTISVFSNKTQVLTPVPVELTSFSANISNGKVVVTWETATETNNSGFSLEASNGNEAFKQIAFIKGKGTTTDKSVYSYVDKSVLSGKYQYRLKQIDYDGSYEYSKVIEIDLGMPEEITLGQNYPNPFNPATTIRYSLPVSAKVSIKVYNTLGEEIATLVNGEIEAGVHEARFNGLDLSSGIYFYRLEAEGIDGSNFSITKRMVLIK
jgi:hypothetical protein